MRYRQPTNPKRAKSKSWDERRARRYALGLLKSRPRTSFEVAARLMDRGVTDVVANSVVGQLLELGILDDARFARDWARYRDRLRPTGEWLLRHELEEKGLDERLIDKVLAARQTPAWFQEIGLAWDDRPIDLVLCEQVATARAARQDQTLDFQKRRLRLGQLLARRGFKPGEVYSVIKRVIKKERGAPG